MSKIKDAMEKVKDYTRYGITPIDTVVDDCIQAYEQNLPTEKEIMQRFGENCNLYSRPIDLFKSFGLLRKEKVKRWKWTNSMVTTNEHFTEEELYASITHKGIGLAWTKVPGSELESDE